MSMTLMAVFICVACTGAVRTRSGLSAMAELKPYISAVPYKVKLLVTRHGLSCANIAQKWVGGWEGGRGSIHDTLLGGAGEQACVDSAEDVKKWLAKNNLEIDAVVSSILGRAMQTALLMFPDDATPLYVVPFISETGSGLSNKPKDRIPQKQSLEKVLNTNLTRRLDYRWMDRFLADLGTWPEFLNFLEQFFLPELVKRLDKPAGSTIVIPVVTHSNFMNTEGGSIKEKCAHTWKARGEDKSLNNQVVDMVYSYSMSSSTLASLASPAFTVVDCGDERLNGAWVQVAGTATDRVSYAKMDNRNVKLEWSKSRTAWRFFVDNTAGHMRPTLYMTTTDSRTVPDDASFKGACDCPGCSCSGRRSPVNMLKDAFSSVAAGVTVAIPHEGSTLSDDSTSSATCECRGQGSAPRIVLYDTSYSLKLSSEPCTEVSGGQSLKDRQGKLRKLCDRDIGETCAKEFAAHLWSAQLPMSTVTDHTYEKILTKAKDSLRDAATKYYTETGIFLGQHAILQATASRKTETHIRPDGPGYHVVDVHSANVLKEQLNSAKALQSAVTNMIAQEKIIKEQKALIDNLSPGPCLSGGKPDVPDYPP